MDANDGEADQVAGTPHPRSAKMLIGHGDHEQNLLRAYRENRLPHAILLGGPAGVGKATLAWRLTRFLLAHPDPQRSAVRDAIDLAVDPGARAAVQVASLSHPDVHVLRREINEKTRRLYAEIRADDVRRAIGLFQRAAGAGGWRICIVDSAEDLNRSSANALLKLIEEPPPRSLFLLVAHRPGLVLATLRSRARLLRLGPLDGAEIEAVVRSLGPPWSSTEPAALAAAAAEAGGSVHEALRRLASPEVGGMDAALARLLDQLPHLDWREVHALADRSAGRDGQAAFQAVMGSVYAWLGRQVRTGEHVGNGAGIRRGEPAAPRRLAPYAEVWEKIATNARETDALNLDKRPLILTIFSDLAAAVRAASH